MGKKKAKKKDEDDKKDEESKSEIQKMKKKQKKKGKKVPETKDVTPVVKVVDKKAIVDQYFSDRAQYHIYADDENYFNGKFFSCTLNKSDLDANNNKFYIIQLLEHDTNNTLVLFTRWGRIGVPGQHEEKDVDSSSGPKMFMRKYKDKTKGGYQEIFIDYEAEVKKDDLPEEKKKKNNGAKKSIIII